MECNARLSQQFVALNFLLARTLSYMCVSVLSDIKDLSRDHLFISHYALHTVWHQG